VRPVSAIGPTVVGTTYEPLTGGPLTITRIRVSNASGSTRSFTLNIGSTAAQTCIYSAVNVPAAGLDIKGPFTLAGDDIVWAKASGSGVSISLWGHSTDNLLFSDNYAEVGTPFTFNSAQKYYSFYGTSVSDHLDGSDMAENPAYGDLSPQTAGIVPTESVFDKGNLIVSANNVSCRYGANTYAQRRGLTRTIAAYQYGYFECRAAIPAGQGFWPALWLWPPYPLDIPEWQEIDLVECPSTAATLAYQNMFWGDTETPNQILTSFSGDFTTKNIWAVDWQPDKVEWSFNGTVTKTYSVAANIPHYPLCFHMDFQVGGPWAGNPDGSTPWPGQHVIDYLRIYNKKRP